MRILVVEDEMISRLKLKTLLQTIGECKTAENGGQAVTMYEAAMAEGKAYQLVMLDIEMPDMKGPQVLRQIRSIEAGLNHRAAVIMVTAQLSQSQVLQCIQEGCDDYIAKPFNINIIREKLLKLGLIGGNGGNDPGSHQRMPTSAEEIFNRINESLRCGELALPPMPQIGIKFRELVRDGAGMDKMADLLKKDVVIASKVISLSNSVSYRGFGKIQSLDKAIGRLGLAETEKLVMALSNQKLFMAENHHYRIMLEDLWLHSLACAYGAEALTGTLEIKLTVDAFTAGLFHDIGAFAMLHIIAELENLGYYDESIDLEAIKETVQVYHTIFGAKLLEKWAFDPGYMRIAMSHSNLHAVDSITPEISVIHLSNLVAKSLGYMGCGSKQTVELMQTQSAMTLQVTEDQINSLQKTVQSQMALVEQLDH